MAALSERKTSTKLSLFVGFADSFSSEGISKSPAAKSPRNFDDGTVGLGIVAAMSDPGETPVAKIPRPAIQARSVPIPIASVKSGADYGSGGGRGGVDNVAAEEELSESYTCVISHVGGKSVRKRVYFDDGKSGGTVRNYWGNPGAIFDSPPSAEPVLPATDFLNRCYLCRKKLHGLDIFMYRGDKAFCSADCRCQQMAMDEQIEKYGSGKLKPFDCSVSPYPAPMNYAAGVAAA